MKQPVVLFEKKSMKLDFFLKAKSQAKAYHQICMQVAREKRRKEKC